MYELRWSLRASFFRYVAGLRDGRASVSEGATLTMDDPQLVVYPADPGRTSDQVLAFRGDLRLGGHGGLLFVRLARPRITMGAAGPELAGPELARQELARQEPAVLSVDNPLTEDGTGPRLDLVTLRLALTPDGWEGVDVRLTEAGVGLFNHVYAAGDPFDPLTVVRR
ncbi:HtaA domain-containing protein [Pseudofrankia asymbiotica]|uniref:Htaa domain-containing protein n=1 Tax=Pseudofrankia asymbiotica TaxID=1834516 RepID=A0A1V2IEP1_9ACTN|nr:HtaA domain-containing protein [Pseudofrankia asymbiotica]ONH31672.1 hypothetical protein BL253_08360 [Pseudofrankia asymbiotica]